MAETEGTPPPAGEQIHLPEPTIVPLLMAVAITVVLIGFTTNIIFSIAGGILFLVTLVLWIRDVRHEIEHLPPE